jgi:hypothetical protein
MDSKWFRFHDAIDVTDALNPAATVLIKAGTWLVNFDDTLSGFGNGAECSVVEPNVRVVRMFRTELISLCEQGRAEPL